MDAQLDELEDECTSLLINVQVAQNLQAIRTEVHQVVEQGTAQKQADEAKKYKEAFTKTCEAVKTLVKACRTGTDKEMAEACIQVVSQISAAVPPPYGLVMGYLCSLTSLIMDGVWDSPGGSPFAAMLGAIKQMIDEAVRELKNHMDAQFRELYPRMARSEVEAIKGQCDSIVAQVRWFEQTPPEQQQDACQSLVRVTEIAGGHIVDSFAKVADCITDFSNFWAHEYDQDFPDHLKGHHGLNCEQLKKGVGSVREVERAINTMYTVVGWRLNQMHQFTDARQMHNRKEYFQAKTREALNSVHTDLGAWEQARAVRMVPTILMDPARIDAYLSQRSSWSPWLSSQLQWLLPVLAAPGYFVYLARGERIPEPPPNYFDNVVDALLPTQILPHTGDPVGPERTEEVRNTLFRDAEAIRRLRRHVQQLHDQI